MLEKLLLRAFDFASELLRLNRTALHLYMDEADTFAPQMRENRQQKLCFGTVSRLVKQGDIRGVGVTMITQRPAELNKKVLSQVDILTVPRMSHPRDLAAATDWIKSEVSPESAGEVGEALPSLPVGTTGGTIQAPSVVTQGVVGLTLRMRGRGPAQQTVELCLQCR